MVPQNYYPPPVHVPISDIMGGNYQQLNGDYTGPASTTPIQNGGYQPNLGYMAGSNDGGQYTNGQMWYHGAGGSLPLQQPTAGPLMNGGYYQRYGNVGTRTAGPMGPTPGQSTFAQPGSSSNGPKPKRRSPKVNSDQPLYSTSPLVHDGAPLPPDQSLPSHPHPHPQPQSHQHQLQGTYGHQPHTGPYDPSLSGSFPQTHPYGHQSDGLGITGLHPNPNIPMPISMPSATYQPPSMEFQASSVYQGAIHIDTHPQPLVSNVYERSTAQIPYQPPSIPHQAVKVDIQPQQTGQVSKTRKPFTSAQSAYLEQYRQTNPSPNNEEKAEIARMINDTLPRVHNWFLNHKAKSVAKAKAKAAEEGNKSKHTSSKSPTKSSSNSRRGSKVSPISLNSGSGDMSRVHSTIDLTSAPMSTSTSTGSMGQHQSQTQSQPQTATQIFDNLRIGHGHDGGFMPTPAPAQTFAHPPMQGQAPALSQAEAQSQYQSQSLGMFGYNPVMDPMLAAMNQNQVEAPVVAAPNFAFGVCHPPTNNPVPASHGNGPAMRINTNLAPQSQPQLHGDRMTGLDVFASQHQHLSIRDQNDHVRRRSSIALGHTDPVRAGGPFSLSMSTERSNPYPSSAARRGSLFPPHGPLRSLSMAPPLQGQGRTSTPTSPYTPSGGSRRNSAQFIPSPWTPRTRTPSGQIQLVTPISATAIRSNGRRVSRMLSQYDKSKAGSDVFGAVEEGAMRFAQPTAIGVPVQETQIKPGFSFGTAAPVAEPGQVQEGLAARHDRQQDGHDRPSSTQDQDQTMAPPPPAAQPGLEAPMPMSIPTDEGTLNLLDKDGNITPEFRDLLLQGMPENENEAGTSTSASTSMEVDTDTDPNSNPIGLGLEPNPTHFGKPSSDISDQDYQQWLTTFGQEPVDGDGSGDIWDEFQIFGSDSALDEVAAQ